MHVLPWSSVASGEHAAESPPIKPAGKVAGSVHLAAAMMEGGTDATSAEDPVSSPEEDDAHLTKYSTPTSSPVKRNSCRDPVETVSIMNGADAAQKFAAESSGEPFAESPATHRKVAPAATTAAVVKPPLTGLSSVTPVGVLPTHVTLGDVSVPELHE